MVLKQSRGILACFMTLLLVTVVLSEGIWVKAAEVVGIDGGIRNATSYQEYVFLSGTPTLFTGSVKVTNSKKKTGETVKLDYTLKNNDGTSTLKRTLSYDVVEGTDTNELANIKCTENINISGTTYALVKDGGYQLSKAGTLSKNLAINFETGEWTGIKTYNVTGGQIGTMTMAVQGNEASNENYWGDAHFQAIKYDLNFVPNETQKTPTNTTQTGANATTTTTTNGTANTTAADDTLLSKQWSGHVEINVSAQRYGNLKYESSLPVTTAYRGTYTRTDVPQAKAVYKYNMPSPKTAGKRVQGTVSLNLRDNASIKKYIAKNLKDVIDKDGTTSIQRVTSLGIIGSGMYFQSNLKITRGDFLKALITACDMSNNQVQNSSSVFKSIKRPDLFIDIGTKSPYYDIVKKAIDNNIIDGQKGGYFRPDNPIIKTDMVAMVIRALGLQDYPYVAGQEVHFKDEKKISSDTKEYFYTLSKLGIIKADSRGNIYPTDFVTRGEAATILDSLLKYLQKDIQKDYDSLVKFN